MISVISNENKFSDIDTVLFDKDGTFIDSHVYWGRIISRRAKSIIKFYNLDNSLYKKLCLVMGYDLDLSRLIEAGPIALLPRSDVIKVLKDFLFSINIDANIDDLVAIFDEVHLKFADEMFDYIKLLDGAVELFNKLKSHGAKLAVVTSDSVSNTEKILDYFKISGYFDSVIGKDSCVEPKRTGIPALYVLEKLGSLQDNTIAIGDAKMDFDMASAAGLRGSVLVATGQIPCNKLKLYSEFCVNSLREIDIK